MSTLELDMYQTEYVESGDHEAVDVGALGPCIGLIIQDVHTKAVVASHQVAGWAFDEAISTAVTNMAPIEDHKVYIGGGSIVCEDDEDTVEAILEARDEVVASLLGAGYQRDQLTVEFNDDEEFASMVLNMEDGIVEFSTWSQEEDEEE